MSYDFHRLPPAVQPLSGDEVIGISQLLAPKSLTLQELAAAMQAFGSRTIDGGFPSTKYLVTQNIEGGDPATAYLPSQYYNGGTP